MEFTLIAAGILAGLVNYFYVYLNLPVSKEPNPATLDEGGPGWELPKKTYWLALWGYLIIGIAGSFLTPLIDALVDLKGSPVKPGELWDNWILLGYGIVFGFSTNRILSSVVGNIIARINVLEKGRNNPQQQVDAVNKFEAPVLVLDSDLKKGEHSPSDKSEVQASGAASSKIVRDSAEFKALKKNDSSDIVFKDEEGTGADRMMNTLIYDCINTLASKVKSEWKDATGKPVYKLRITEAWDENNEHGTNSLHYEARAADINLWHIKNNVADTSKLGRLSGLAIDSGFDWVFYEDDTHVHVSTKKA